MKNPILLEIMTHWERLRAGRIAPLRSEIDPRQIENALEYAFILERTTSGNARFRIAGMQLCDLMNMEVRGMPATALINPDCRAKYARAIQQMFENPVILELQLTAHYPSRSDLRAEMLLLPMKGESGEVTRILGCLVPDGQAAAPPNRFTIIGQKTTRIIATQPTISSENSFRSAEQPSAFAATSNQCPKARTRHRPEYLRLVTTSD